MINKLFTPIPQTDTYNLCILFWQQNRICTFYLVNMHILPGV